MSAASVTTLVHETNPALLGADAKPAAPGAAARPAQADPRQQTAAPAPGVSHEPPLHVSWAAEVPLPVIRRFPRQVAERFAPDQIILFGSHAYGTPHADSDVDILVIMPTRNQHDQAARIRGAVEAPFP